MKKLFKVFLFLALITPVVSSAQIQGVLYRTDKWADIAKYGNWTKAMDNPRKEYAEVLITERVIKVTTGAVKRYYGVVKRIEKSNTEIVFKVEYKGKNYDLKVTEIEDSTYFKIDGLWMIEANNTNRRVVDID